MYDFLDNEPQMTVALYFTPFWRWISVQVLLPDTYLIFVFTSAIVSLFGAFLLLTK